MDSTRLRVVALCFVVVASGVFGLNYWYFLQHGAYFVAPDLVTPALFLLGVGGLLDPAIVLSLKDVELPFRSRAIGIGLAVVGLILGLILHITLFLQ